MDEIVQRSIQLVQAKQRDEVPWKMDDPHQQPYYAWAGVEKAWRVVEAPTVPGPANDSTQPNNLALYSWNIDFMLPLADSRMHAAIRHLQSLTDTQSSDLPSVIFLAECVASDLELIAADPWVRRTFQLTDLVGTYWQSGHYGTTILIDRRIPVSRCFRVHYFQSRMERDGLFVDVSLGGRTIRLCNTHLESLALEPAYRPPQMQLCAKYMHASEVDGAVLAGDLNAIQDFDKHLHTDNDLRDAYLDLGGSEEDSEGHTWGQQAATAQRERFGTSRMDKVFYCGGVKCTSFQRFGQGVELEDDGERDGIVKLGFDRPWITDHLGVHAVFEVVA